MIVKILSTGILIITINLVIQALGNIFWLRKITHFIKKQKIITNNTIFKSLLFSFLLFTLVHTIHSLIWAGFYYGIPETNTEFTNFSETLYFSLVTFTTLGYGDISLSSEWQLLSGLEAINGIMLIGWSTAMMYSLVQNIYKKLNTN